MMTSNRPLEEWAVRDEGDPTIVDLAKYRLVCHIGFGGHLKEYHAAA
jgi:hypothetical protein